MKRSDLISQIETFVKEAISQPNSMIMIAHDFKHVDRVRNWALIIADAEQYANIEMVEIAALLHDIGLKHLDEKTERPEHGRTGAEIARVYLKENSFRKPGLSIEEIEQIADAIQYHSLHPQAVAEHLRVLGDKGKLIEIIRDADNLDALGAIGLIRAFTSKFCLPDYNPLNIKGGDWELTTAILQAKHEEGTREKASQPVNTIIDQVNRQIGYYQNLHTKSAKEMAAPLVQFMVNFVLQLEREITARRW